MKKILPTIFLIVGSIIGAGFASGRELSLFFAEFGYASLYFLPIVFILFYYSFKIFLTLGSKEKYENVLDINKKINSSIFFNIVIITIFIICGSAMFSACIELLRGTFIEVPVIVFYVFVFLLIYFVLRFGFNGLVKVNFFIIPTIVVLLIIYSLYSIFNPITNIDFVPNNSGAYILPFSIFMYVFANILLSYFILAQAGNGLSHKEIQKVSFGASFIICLVILVCIFCLITNGAVIMEADMPFVVLTLRLGDPFPLIFTILLFLGIITSLFSCIHTIKSSLQNKFKSKTIWICCFLIMLLSLLGFKTIVNNFYPVIGFVGIVMIIRILQTKKLHTYFKHI